MVRRKFKLEKPATDDEPLVCDVRECQKDRDRSLPFKKVNEALASQKWRRGLDGPKRVHLCREHYRQFRKATKEARQLERMGRG